MNSKVNGEKNKYIIRDEVRNRKKLSYDAFVPLNSRIKKDHIDIKIVTFVNFQHLRSNYVILIYYKKKRGKIK